MGRRLTCCFPGERHEGEPPLCAHEVVENFVILQIGCSRRSDEDLHVILPECQTACRLLGYTIAGLPD